ncbi:MAG TPA: hypothetical protein VKX17_03685 [Planctomycetota bacterium]|nr:hypothetical protein [Planctomycetota bacterium]
MNLTGGSMTKTQIAEAYQRMVREAFPRAIVRPCEDEWNPYKDECYDVFFIPDSAIREYRNRWHEENGWYDRAEQMGLPKVTLIVCYDSQTKEHYSHRFPEIFGKSATATSKRKLSALTAKRSKTKLSSARAKATR